MIYYSQYMESHKNHVPNHQPEHISRLPSGKRLQKLWKIIIFNEKIHELSMVIRSFRCLYVDQAGVSII